MNSYYFKVKQETGNHSYCEFEAEDYNRAKRNLFFCCFSHRELDLQSEYPHADERFSFLFRKYFDLVEDCSKEEFLKMEQYEQ
jgi:hypothetical protein